MALETATYINGLVATNPVSGDQKSQGDDHLRLIKSAILATWPSVTGAVTPTHTELNYVDGVTSGIQGQLDLKAPLANPTFTGVPAAPTAEAGATGAQIATLDYVIATSLSASLPGQTGNAGKILSTDGTNGAWYATLDGSVVSLLSGGDIVGTTETQTLEAKTLETPIFQDSTDATKKANLILSGITAGQNRNITLADENMTLFTGYARLLSKVTASNSATVDLETTFDSTYDEYIIEVSGLNIQTTSTDLRVRFKIGGAYVTGAVYRFRTGAGTLNTSQTEIEVFDALATTTNPNVMLTCRIAKPADTSHRHTMLFLGVDSNACEIPNPIGQCTTTGALTGVRFYMSSGNITTGDFKLFGIRKS